MQVTSGIREPFQIEIARLSAIFFELQLAIENILYNLLRSVNIRNSGKEYRKALEEELSAKEISLNINQL